MHYDHDLRVLREYEDHYLDPDYGTIDDYDERDSYAFYEYIDDLIDAERDSHLWD